MVGPEKLGRSPWPVPGTLEEGGKEGKRKNPRRVKRSVGDGGIIQVGAYRVNSVTGKRYRTPNYRNWGTSKRVYGIGGRRFMVAFGKLKTAAMVAHAEKLEEKVYGPMMLGKTRIKARPFMRPALEAVTTQLARIWRDAIY